MYYLLVVVLYTSTPWVHAFRGFGRSASKHQTIMNNPSFFCLIDLFFSFFLIVSLSNQIGEMSKLTFNQNYFEIKVKKTCHWIIVFLLHLITNTESHIIFCEREPPYYCAHKKAEAISLSNFIQIQVTSYKHFAD